MPARLATLTMLPPSRRNGAAARESTTGAARLTVIISTSASGAKVSAGPRWCTPALLMTMSSAPMRSTTRCGRSATAARSLTSRAKGSPLICSAAWRSVFSVRATRATLAPSAASFFDTASPIPAEAPVTSATLPSSTFTSWLAEQRQRARVVFEKIGRVRVLAQADAAVLEPQQKALRQPLQAQAHDLLRLLGRQHFSFQAQKVAVALQVLRERGLRGAVRVELAAEGGGRAALLEARADFPHALGELRLGGVAAQLQRRAGHQ